jgi:hypothetical protein
LRKCLAKPIAPVDEVAVTLGAASCAIAISVILGTSVKVTVPVRLAIANAIGARADKNFISVVDSTPLL